MSEISSSFEKHIPVTQNASVAVDLIASETGLSKQVVKNTMQKGAVWVTKGKKTQRLRRAKRLLSTTETVHIYYDEHVLNTEVPEPELLADLGQYSVWKKPYGMLSQGSKWGDHCTITRWAEQHLSPQRTSFVVHRLDRAANGIILVAHEKNAAAALSKLFHDRKVEKRYRISVHGQFPEQAKTQAVTIDSAIDGRSAQSHFMLVEYDAVSNRSLLDVSIDTGRKHQIRRHSAELGFPVVGDRMHGITGDKENLQLNAYFMSFMCPFTRQKKQFDLLA